MLCGVPRRTKDQGPRTHGTKVATPMTDEGVGAELFGSLGVMVALLEKTPPLFKIDPAERRLFERKENHTRVEGRRLDHSIPARQHPQLSLALRDLSLGGLSAIS